MKNSFVSPFCYSRRIWRVRGWIHGSSAAASRLVGLLVVGPAGYHYGSFAGTGNLAHPIWRGAIQEIGPGGLALLSMSAVRPPETPEFARRALPDGANLKP